MVSFKYTLLLALAALMVLRVASSPAPGPVLKVAVRDEAKETDEPKLTASPKPKKVDDDKTKKNTKSDDDNGKDDDKDKKKKDDDNGKDDGKKDDDNGKDDGKKDDDDDDKGSGAGSSSSGGSSGSGVGGIPNEAQGGAPCFPGSALVELAGGARKPMSALAIGDRIRVADGYSEVFMFTHRLAAARYEFVELCTARATVRLTEGHYLPVNGHHTAAGKVRVGDALQLGDGSVAAVTAVRRVQGEGLYNPQTAAGTAVVDGVVTSCYTQAVQSGAAHALLAPLRALFARGYACRALEAGGGSFTQWMPKGAAMA